MVTGSHNSETAKWPFLAQTALRQSHPSLLLVTRPIEVEISIALPSSLSSSSHITSVPNADMDALMPGSVMYLLLTSTGSNRWMNCPWRMQDTKPLVIRLSRPSTNHAPE